jgi:acetyl esterase
VVSEIGGGVVPDEGVLDPWVAEWLEANPIPDDFSPETVALARGSFDLPVRRQIDRVHDESITGVPVRMYEHAKTPTGLVVYFHGGGWCIGSVALMDNVARELAHATGAAVISVEYRLAPEHPYPAGLDDCEAVTRWALANAPSLGVPQDRVMVAGESAGGNFAAAVCLRLRDARAAPRPIGQILIYPVLDAHGSAHASRQEFMGLVVSEKTGEWFWNSYSGGGDIAHDPFAVPLRATTLADLPAALIILGGCDFLRDEGRAYAKLLRDAGVDVEEVCYPGQPHGFVNFEFPAARDALETIGRWARRLLVDGS